MTNDELTKKDSMPKVLLNFFQKIAVSKGGAFSRARAFSKVNCALAQERTFWSGSPDRHNKRFSYMIKIYTLYCDVIVLI